ncbi:MAG: pyridoxamine 5'-phosphate oxidase family protein [Pseudomonadota bacterium]
MPHAADRNPLELLAADREQARARQDPCANLCTLATVDTGGHPQARTLALRDLQGRLAVFLNETSPKWRQLQASASAAVVVWLPSLEVQYRLQCDTRPVVRTDVHESWKLRPDTPKRLDWFYTRVQPQSSPLSGRELLERHLSTLALREPLVAPRTAAGVYLEPFRIERLDLTMPDGLHDRRSFERHSRGWHETVLVP